jgi:phosphoketolase
MPDTQLVTNSTGPLSSKQLRGLDAYWRAANYLSVGQVYLLDNPLLREPLAIEHVKPRLYARLSSQPARTSRSHGRSGSYCEARFRFGRDGIRVEEPLERIALQRE